MSCFVFKVMGLTFHDRTNTQCYLSIRVSSSGSEENYQTTKKFLGSNLTSCSFFIQFFFIFGGGGVGWEGGLILLFTICLIFFFLLYYYFFYFYPFNMHKAHI